MATAARKHAENKRFEKLSKDEARAWLYEQAEASGDRSFVITLRNLGVTWGWSTVRVRNLLNSMEMAGQLHREVLSNNGGTRLTIAEQGRDPVVVPLIPKSQAVKYDSATGQWLAADIKTIQSLPSKILTARLAQAYHGIIYDKPGFEHCDIEHLEMIERALFPDMCPSLQQAA
jgi:hypothetical protein